MLLVERDPSYIYLSLAKYFVANADDIGAFLDRHLLAVSHAH